MPVPASKGELLLASKSFVSTIGDAVDRREIPGDHRTRGAASCPQVSQEHHGAIIHLTESRHHGSAAALLRLQMEALVRGAWLQRCAEEIVVANFLAEGEPPAIKTMLDELDLHDWSGKKLITEIKRKSWKALCDYTHTGSRQVSRRYKDGEVIQNYSDDDQVELLVASNLFALVGVGEFSYLSNCEEASTLVLASYELLPLRA